MKLKKIIILSLVLYFLTLLQTSFLVHFALFGFVINLAAILVILLNFFEREKNFFSAGFILSLIGGFFLDIYSSRPIGFYIALLALLSILIKVTIKRYVRIPLSEKY